MSISPDAKLELTYEQFLAVLEKCNAYIAAIEFSEMPTGIPVWTPTDDFNTGRCGGEGVAVAASIKLPDLADFLWRCLENGVDEVESIHAQIYADKQVDFFRYCFVEHLITDSHLFERPTDLFLKLGEPAQLKIISSGLLKAAMSNWDKEEAL